MHYLYITVRNKRKESKYFKLIYQSIFTKCSLEKNFQFFTMGMDDDLEISMTMIKNQNQTFASGIRENTAIEGDGKKNTTNIITSFTSTTIPNSSDSSRSCNLSQTGNSNIGDNSSNNSGKSSYSFDSGRKTRELLIEDYLRTLQATDSIMEPNIDITIKGFLRNGGHPEVVITSLTNSYRGLAQYCELLGDWLSDLEGDRRIVHECFEKSLSSLLEKRFVAEVVDRNFDAAGDVDKWLPELLKHSKWRNLIYTLIEQNPRSRFLTKAIRIISDAGFQHEITNVHLAAQQENNEVAAACTYLSQILRREAHKRNYQDSYDIHIALNRGYNDCGNSVKQIIYAMLSKKCLNQADIIRLYEHYNSSEPPVVEFIQDPFFIDMLIDALFAYEGCKVQLSHRSKYIFLLSYASCCSTSNDTNMEKEDEEMERTEYIMEKILDSIRSEREFLKDIRLLLSGIEFTPIAGGLLHYLQGFLLNNEILTEFEMVHFVLLDEIATKHSGLHIRLFKMLCELYDRQSKSQQPAEMIIAKQRSIIDRFVHLLSVGFALPVVEKINKMFQEGQIDVSLARYFAIDVLDIIEPPYSEEFIETFLPMVLNREIFDKLTMIKVPAATQFIQDITTETVGSNDEVEFNTNEVLSELNILDTCNTTTE
uniref:Bm10607, isoform d n=1 Tax=Brugia malayi TaxID=6279 RepID=A0A1I9G3Z7_BRUMA|nr:Bm10607, isoform d [Brugia malayi]